MVAFWCSGGDGTRSFRSSKQSLKCARLVIKKYWKQIVRYGVSLRGEFFVLSVYRISNEIISDQKKVKLTTHDNLNSNDYRKSQCSNSKEKTIDCHIDSCPNLYFWRSFVHFLCDSLQVNADDHRTSQAKIFQSCCIHFFTLTMAGLSQQVPVAQLTNIYLQILTSLWFACFLCIEKSKHLPFTASRKINNLNTLWHKNLLWSSNILIFYDSRDKIVNARV